MGNPMWLLAASLLLSPVVAVAAPDIAPELKGIRLGITLQEFHDLAYPNSPHWGEKYGDSDWRVRLEDHAKIAATIAEEKAEIVLTFKLDPAARENSRLYFIEATFTAQVAQIALAGLSKKYGRPVMRRTRDGLVAEWEFISYAITLRASNADDGDAVITMYHVKMAEEARQKIRARKAEDI